MKALPCLRLSVGAILLLLPLAAMAENAVTTGFSSVRAGPDSSYPEVAQLDEGVPIDVVGCLEDWSWCDVAFEGNRGWLYSPDITYEYEGGYVPLYSYAPALGVPVVPFALDVYWGSYYHDRPWYAQRDQWVRRQIHHERPTGPPPSESPPPRQAVLMERPHRDSPPDRSIRLGNADPSRRDAVPHEGTGRHEGAELREGAPAHVDTPAAERRASDPRAAEPRDTPPHVTDPHAMAPRSAEPRPTPPPERNARPREDQPHRESDKPEGPPRKD